MRPHFDWSGRATDETDQGNRRGSGADGGGAWIRERHHRRSDHRTGRRRVVSAPATSPPRPPRRRRASGDGGGRERRDHRAGSARDHRGRSTGDHGGGAGGDGSTGDASRERHRARRRRDDQHQSAAARQPPAGRSAAPAGRVAGGELEPRASRRQRVGLRLRAAADDLLPVADRQRGGGDAEPGLRARLLRVRRPPHADVHAQPRGGVAQRRADHRRRLEGDVELAERLEPRVPGRVDRGLRPDLIGRAGRRRVRGRRHVLRPVRRPRGAVLEPHPGCIGRRSGDVQHRLDRPDQQRLDDRPVRGRDLRRGGAAGRAGAERHVVGRSTAARLDPLHRHQRGRGAAGVRQQRDRHATTSVSIPTATPCRSTRLVRRSAPPPARTGVT